MRTSIKKFILTLGISCVGLISFAQTVTIGYGTESSGLFPYYNSYRYAVTQSIYTASEIGNAGQIASIAYNVANASSYADQDVKIYMGHTALNTFASTASALTEDDLTLVYEGTLTLGTSTGWEKIYLKNVFEYNGVDNLVIAVARKNPENGTLNGTLEYYFSDGSTLNCNDNSDESFGEISHSMIGNWGSRPNIQIGFAPALVDEYYQIGDANDLLWFANYVNSGNTTINGKLIADIDLTDIEWTPIGGVDYVYRGTFDGNGDTIRNLTYSTTTDYVGLFGWVGPGGKIQNVGLINSSITGNTYAGGIAGVLYDGTISKCCYKGAVSGAAAVGGIAGRCQSSGSVENCYSMADVTSTGWHVGGICGYNTGVITNTYVGKNKTITAGGGNAGGVCGYNEGTLTSCHTIDISSVSSPTYCGGLVGKDNGGTYSNCTYYQYAAMDGNSTRQNGLGNEAAGSTTTNPTGVSSKDYDFTSAVGSGNYCYLLNGSQNAGATWKQTIGDDKYPVLDTTHLPIYKIGGRAYANKEITFAGGSGDPWTPFQISTAEELKNFAYLVNLGNSSLSGALTADIVLNENVLDENGNLRSDYKTANLEQWTPMSSFSGSFLGSNHTISGLYINSSMERVGLFKDITSSGRVSYLGIVDSYISGSSYVGALAGQTSGATITSCYNTGVVEGGYNNVGGLIGMAGGTITDCYNTGNVSSKGNRVGGIGGCFGYYSGSATVTGCYNTGNVTSTSPLGQVGGLAGALVNSTITFSKCYNTGTIIGKNNVGGCFGYISSSSHSATDCYNTGSVVATGGDAGGIVASNAGSIRYCFNGGSVAGTGNVGGVASSNTGTISYCYYNSDFCSHGGINSEDVANSAQALTSTNFTSTLPTNFDSEVWTAGNTQGASASIISEDGIMGYRVIGKYPSITGVGTAQEIVVKYVNVGTEKQPNWISNFIPIYTITDFKNIRYNLSATYVLMNDIVETENFSSLNVFTPTVTWPTIGPFTGKIYGNNHTVSGVYVKGEGSTRVGLINTADGALIRDLGLIKSKIQGEMPGTYAGGICGYMEGDATIFNCYNSAEVIGMVAGGITSKGYHATITQCRNYGKITSMASENADGIIGGIIGELYFTTVQQCYNEGTITSDLKAGGIAGEGGYDRIYNSYNAGAVSGQIAGGILGVNGTARGHSNCLNIGTISGSVNAGAILGSGSASSGALYNCYYDNNTSNIEGGIDGSDVQNMAEGIETDELCLELQAGFSSDIWGVKAPIVEGNKKYLYYPYLKCFGEESAKLATYRPISRVVLNQNGGTCTPLTQYIEREGATLPQDVVREGYTFGGWYTNASCTSDEVTEIPVTAIGEQTFYAKWTANDYEVSLCANGGSINSGSVTRYTYGTYTTLPTDVSRTGYTFKGWYPALTCNVCDLVLDSVPPSSRGFAIILLYHEFSELGISNQEAVEMVYNAPSVIASQISIDDAMYYKQKLEEYDAVVSLESFGLQEGKLLCDLVLESYGNDKLNVVKIVRNYTGLGLLEAKNLVETAPVTVLTQVPLENAEAMKSAFDTLSGVVSSFANNTGGQPISVIYPTDLGDKQFGAKWEANKYAVNLQENGGTNTKNIDEYTYGISVTLPDETEITREGYSFAGWYMNSSFNGTAVKKISTSDYGDKTFYAKWVPKEYAITFDVNGGVFNSNYPESYIYGTTTLLPSSVSRPGYSFNGWIEKPWYSVRLDSYGDSKANVIKALSEVTKYSLSESSDIVNKVPVELTYSYLEDKANEIKDTLESYGATVTIQNKRELSIKYEIYLNSYGDSKAAVAKAVKNILNIGISEALKLVLQAPVKLAIVDTETEANEIRDTLENYGASVSFFSTLDYPVNVISSLDCGDRYYQASWNIIDYDIKYNFNNGTTEEVYVNKYNFGDEITLPIPTREGYEFGGWYNNSNLVGTEFTGIAATETGNKEFWAKWNVNSYTVAFETNGGTINSGRIKNYVYGTTIVLPYDVTKTGYTFDGWYTDEACSGEAVLSILSTDLGNKTFYANWIVNSYNIILVTNEGTINSENIENYTYGTGATLPTNVTKTGYTFGGWYSNSSYIGGPVMSIANNDMGDKQFWAKWTINTYNVKTVAENGTVEGSGLYEYKSTATLKAIANEGYEFVGWNDNELKDERIQLTVTKDTTLTANFKEKEKVEIVGTLEIPTLKTERESAPIDLAGLFTTTEGGEVIYSAASSAPNVVAATVNDGKLFLTVYEYEGEAEITVTATLPNGEKNTVKATATVVLACNIQVEETITNVSCYGESDGEIALKVTNAAEPYTTLWTGDATEDTLRNVTAGNYTVDITDNEGCTFTKTYTVSQPEEMKLSAKIKNPTCDNADGSITITLTDAENASFAWSNESTAQNVANLVKGDYSVVITNTETGCQISDSYTLTEPEAPVISVATTVATACNEANGAVYISTNSDDLRYMWSNSKTTKDLENVRAGDYTLEVVDSKNCKASLNVTIPSIKLKQPEIALVTVSQESGKNLVVWLKENTDLIDYYTIYRVDSAKNKYDKVVDVPYSELSVYEDLAANPMERAWKYKMTATDVCGEETAMSDYHSSLHLMKVKSLGVENHLMWDPYEGIDFDSYVILRKTKVKGVVEIDTLATVPSDLTSYTDTLPARGTTSYYVGVKLPETINPKTQFLKAESGPFVIALSNIAEVENYVAVQTVVKSNAKVYAIGHTIYVKNADYAETAVYDVNGGKINFAKDAAEYEFDIKLDGIYLVKVGNETFKVIVK